jgi:hypothetical protein
MIADRNNVCVFCDICVHPVPSCSLFRGGQLTCLDCFQAHGTSCRTFVDKTASTFASMKDPNAPPDLADVLHESPDVKDSSKCENNEDNEDNKKPAAKEDEGAKKKRKSLFFAIAF